MESLGGSIQGFQELKRRGDFPPNLTKTKKQKGTKTLKRKLLLAFVILGLSVVATQRNQPVKAAGQNAPKITSVSGTVALGVRGSIGIDGSGFEPSLVQVVVFGGKCTEQRGGCVIPNEVLAEDGGVVTETRLSAVPVTINDAGIFEVAVRNGEGAPLSNRGKFTVK